MAKRAYPSQALDKFILRMPDGMRQRIEDVAAKNGRSMNAEIVQRLESSFEHQSQLFATLERMRVSEEAVEDLKRENETLREAMDAEDGVEKHTADGLPEGRKLVLRLWRAQQRFEAALKDLQRLFPGIGSVTFREKPEDAAPPVKRVMKPRKTKTVKPRSRKR